MKLRSLVNHDQMNLTHDSKMPQKKWVYGRNKFCGLKPTPHCAPDFYNISNLTLKTTAIWQTN